jgi:hypothetical protein
LDHPDALTLSQYDDPLPSALSTHFELLVYALIALLAGVVRFYKIWHPTSVVCVPVLLCRAVFLA